MKMNVFQLSAILTPLLGALGASKAVKTAGAFPMALGIGVGLVTGVVLLFVVFGLVALLARLPGVMSEAPRGLAWAASMTAVLLPMLSPIAAWFLSSFIVTQLLHL